MTEEGKKEFEEFLQWKKEKQEREKLHSEDRHRHIVETDKITGSHSENEIKYIK